MKAAGLAPPQLTLAELVDQVLATRVAWSGTCSTCRALPGAACRDAAGEKLQPGDVSLVTIHAERRAAIEDWLRKVSSL